ncbi:MAG: hypothetical protein ABI618_18505 [Nitrospirota bacterium]
MKATTTENPGYKQEDPLKIFGLKIRKLKEDGKEGIKPLGYNVPMKGKPCLDGSLTMSPSTVMESAYLGIKTIRTYWDIGGNNGSKISFLRRANLLAIE